jgi:hypothetical protein
MSTAAGGHITVIDISPDLLALAWEWRLLSVELLEKSFEAWETD